MTCIWQVELWDCRSTELGLFIAVMDREADEFYRVLPKVVRQKWSFYSFNGRINTKWTWNVKQSSNLLVKYPLTMASWFPPGTPRAPQRIRQHPNHREAAQKKTAFECWPKHDCHWERSAEDPGGVRNPLFTDWKSGFLIET